jgi:hypothetical protein
MVFLASEGGSNDVWRSVVASEDGQVLVSSDDGCAEEESAFGAWVSGTSASPSEVGFRVDSSDSKSLHTNEKLNQEYKSEWQC